MTSRLLAALAILVTAGAAFAQGAGGGASNPTKVDAETTGPQDSIGSAGESPTKSMIDRSDRKNAKGRDESGARSEKEKDKPASALGAKKSAPGDRQSGAGK